jgi:heme oxygenase
VNGSGNKEVAAVSPSVERSPLNSLSYSRSFLRRATRFEHAAAENTAVMRALFDGQLGEAAYVRLLQGYHSLYDTWERRHATWLLGDLMISGWRYQTRLLAIESDLRRLGAQPALRLGESIEPLQLPSKISQATPHIAQVSWGSLYVIEGSALGGQIIARKLTREFPHHQHLFFSLGHGKGRPGWKDFQGLIANQLRDTKTRRKIALQARAAFGVFQHMLDGVMH